ncbi:MAG: hypothetical protein ACLPV4_18645 [Solirubrobacteraceae bacterium]
MIFYDEAAGKLLSITLYETEDDMRRGDATLNARLSELTPAELAIDPPATGGTGGGRRSVQMYEVLAKLDL